MRALKQRISEGAQNLGDGILNVTGFINHQVDVALMDRCGRELAGRFADAGATKVLTAETSGIAPALTTALHLGVLMVYARKAKPITLPERVFHTRAPSHTGGSDGELIVSPEYLRPEDRVLIVDDFLAFGHTVIALARLVRMAEATLVGVGVLVEKSFEEGRIACGPLQVPVEALATVVDMRAGRIILA